MAVQFDQYKVNPALEDEIFHNPSGKFAGEQKGSVRVNEGDRVRQGDVIGLL